MNSNAIRSFWIAAAAVVVIAAALSGTPDAHADPAPDCASSSQPCIPPELAIGPVTNLPKLVPPDSPGTAPVPPGSPDDQVPGQG